MTDARQLSRRERQIMDIVYRRGQATAADVIEDMPDPPSYSAVRSVLRILQEKGHLRHEQQGRRYVFQPVVAPDRARRSALEQVVHTFFGGSTSDAVAALLDMPSSQISESERIRLAALIERARKGRPVAMDPLQTFTVLTDPTWLADAAVRSAALLAGAGLLATGAHRAPAAMRHLIWAVALATSLALPAVSGRMPSITMVVPESLASLVARPASVTDPPSAATAPPRTPPPPEHADSTATPRVEPTGSPIGSTTRPAASPLDWPAALLLLWSAGALFVMLRFTVGLGTAWCMSRAAATIDDPSWRHLAQRLVRSTRPGPNRPVAAERARERADDMGLVATGRPAAGRRG